MPGAAEIQQLSIVQYPVCPVLFRARESLIGRVIPAQSAKADLSAFRLFADVPTKFRASAGPPVSLQTTAAGYGAAMVQHM